MRIIGGVRETSLHIDCAGSANRLGKIAIVCKAFHLMQTRFYLVIKCSEIVIAFGIDELHRVVAIGIDIFQIIDFQRVHINGKAIGTEIKFVIQGEE